MFWIYFVLSFFILAQNEAKPRRPKYPNAECRITWNIPTNCDTVQNKIQKQMEIWKETSEGKEACPGTSEECPRLPCGQKCRYVFEGVDEVGRVTGYHLTPAFSFKDSISFEFAVNESSCNVVGFSKSTVYGAWLDSGTNYCNLRNLLDGANLSQVNGFTEETNVLICTQYDRINCERF